MLLIVPAPIKRAYAWNLLPGVSVVRRCVVRRCLDRSVRVYLLEWLDPGPAEDGFGLVDYAERLPLGAAAAETGEAVAVLAGHSLGGTFAAVFASLHPGRVRGLMLLDASLAFGPGRAARACHGGRAARAHAARDGR